MRQLGGDYIVVTQKLQVKNLVEELPHRDQIPYLFYKDFLSDFLAMFKLDKVLEIAVFYFLTGV